MLEVAGGILLAILAIPVLLILAPILGRFVLAIPGVVLLLYFASLFRG